MPALLSCKRLDTSSFSVGKVAQWLSSFRSPQRRQLIPHKGGYKCTHDYVTCASLQDCVDYIQDCCTKASAFCSGHFLRSPFNGLCAVFGSLHLPCLWLCSHKEGTEAPLSPLSSRHDYSLDRLKLWDHLQQRSCYTVTTQIHLYCKAPGDSSQGS